jgi:hypothetical protein
MPGLSFFKDTTFGLFRNSLNQPPIRMDGNHLYFTHQKEYTATVLYYHQESMK